MPYDPLTPPLPSRLNPPQPTKTLAYFVTLIVKERACLLAEIRGDDLQLTDYGLIVQQEWFKTGLGIPGIKADESEFVVMPNHIHGIIRILPEEPRQRASGGWIENPTPFNRTQSNTLPSFIRAFKAGVNQRLTTPLPKGGNSFWERSYEEQRIHGESILKRILQRIQINPYRWTTDPLHPDFLANRSA